MPSVTALKNNKVGWLALGALVLLVPMARAEPSMLDSPGSTAAASGTNNLTNPSFDFSNVEIVDSALNSKLTLLRVGSQRASNNLLGVFVGLKNTTAKHLVIEVETVYKDKSGNELNTGSWIKLTLKPHQESDYRSASISESAVDFLIRVRRPPQATASNHE